MKENLKFQNAVYLQLKDAGRWNYIYITYLSDPTILQNFIDIQDDRT